MSKMIQEKNNIFALYKKTMYISETYSPDMKPPVLRQQALMEEME